MTLEQYILKCKDVGIIDHALRFHVMVDGKPAFYIHPANTGGDTIDFVVDGNTLRPLEMHAGKE